MKVRGALSVPGGLLVWVVWFFLKLNANKKGSWQGVTRGLLTVSKWKWRVGELIGNRCLSHLSPLPVAHTAELQPTQDFLVREIPPFPGERGPFP